MRRWLCGAALLALALTSGPRAGFAEQPTASEAGQRIAKALRDSGKVKDYKIGVKYKDGVVWLTGNVTSQRQMQAALEVVSDLPGVQKVVNNLTVVAAKSPAASPNSPGDAQANVRQAAAQTPTATTPTAGQTPGRTQQPMAVRPAQQTPAILRQPAGMQAPRPMPAPVGRQAAAGGSQGRPQQQQQARRTMVYRGVPIGYKQLDAPETVATPAPNGARPGMPPGQFGPAGPMQGQGGYPRPGYPAAYGQGAYGPGVIDDGVVNGGMVNGGMAGGNAGAAGAYGARYGAAPPMSYDQPSMPNYSWPSYAAYPNYAAVCYPNQYSATAWPFIGPFYPYPQVPMGWRKVSLEWDDGWWFLDFEDRSYQ